MDMIIKLSVLAFLLPKFAVTFNLTILHTNDVHSRFLSYNSNVQPCSKKDIAKNRCWGGAARRATAIAKFRAMHKNSLLLDGGDQFQGSLWYSVMKWRPVAAQMNLLNYTAMTFGNHEFDDGDTELAEFISSINFPVINSNVDASKSKNLNGTFPEYRIFDVDGQKIAILGTTTVDTPDISFPGIEVRFLNEITALRPIIDKLKNTLKINKIIVISHSGVEIDMMMCKELPDLDLVVGGHTHTFLYSGLQLDNQDESEGPYPIVVERNQSKCLVVQASAYGKYLGLLHVEFDHDGAIINWEGNPVLIDANFEEDSKMSELLMEYERNLTDMERQVVGSTLVPLTTVNDVCRTKECALGNLLADSMLEYMKTKLANHHVARDNWNNLTTPIFGLATMNSGGIRQFSIKAESNITLANIYSLLPFSNTIKVLILNGSMVHRLFERAIDKFSVFSRNGKFLQISGANVEYQLQCGKPVEHKIEFLNVSCIFNCENILFYEKLDLNKTYVVVMPSYMASGGDGYHFLRNSNFINLGDDLDVDVMLHYIDKIKPIRTTIENRINVVKNQNCGSIKK